MVNPRFVIKAVISGQRLNINVPLTVSGTVNYIGVEAKCTSEWNGCTIVGYILQPSTGFYAQMALIYDQEKDLYYFPNAERLVLSAGEWDIWFVGIVAESGQEKYRVTTETKVFTVYANDFEKRLPQGNITLDEEAIARATDAQNKANLLLDKYNAGDLTGPKGDPGDPAHIGFVQASVDNTTSNPSCEVTVTQSPENTYNMQFAFSGIKGAKGDTGATGPKGDTGAQGAPGRDGTNGRDGQDGRTIDDYVLVQANQPTSETNKMWLKPTASGDPVMIPTVDEFQTLQNTVNEIIVGVNTPVDYTYSSNYVMNGGSGSPATNVGNAYKLSSFIPVQAGEIYYLTASMNYGNYFYRFYNTETEPSFSAKGSGGYKAAAGSAFTSITNRKIVIPANATFMRIGYNTGSGHTHSLVKTTSIAAIAGEVTEALQAELDAKYQPIKKWAGKKWVAIGDSLTEVNNTASTKYHDLIANNTGITVLNYGKSGTGYGKTYSTFDNFCDRVLTLGDVDCDIITIFGSFNDLSLDLGTADDTGTSTLGGYMNTTFDNLYSTKPFVSVGIILPTPWWGKTPAGTSADAVKAQQYCDMLTTIAKRRSIPVLDLFHNSNLQPGYSNFRDEFYSNADGVHPNNAGHAKIAPMIEQFLAEIIPY